MAAFSESGDPPCPFGALSLNGATSLSSGTCKVFILCIYCHAVHCARHFYYTVATLNLIFYFFLFVICISFTFSFRFDRSVTGDLKNEKPICEILDCRNVFIKCVFNEGNSLCYGFCSVYSRRSWKKEEEEFCAMTDENRDKICSAFGTQWGFSWRG